MNGFEKLRKTIKEFGKLKARAGWFSSARYKNDGVPVAQVAIWQEFGTSTIQPRPFMKPTVLDKSDEWQDLVRRGIMAALRGKQTPYNVMTALAQRAAGDVRLRISETRTPPISPVTHLLREWRRKGIEINKTALWKAIDAVKKGVRASGGNDQPLNDTGHMITTLTGIAVKK